VASRFDRTFGAGVFFFRFDFRRLVRRLDSSFMAHLSFGGFGSFVIWHDLSFTGFLIDSDLVLPIVPLAKTAKTAKTNSTGSP
jgi:hypothetical protein